MPRGAAMADGKSVSYGTIGIIVSLLILATSMVGGMFTMGATIGELKTIASANQKSIDASQKNIDAKASVESVKVLETQLTLKADASLIAVVDKITGSITLLSVSNATILERINTISVAQAENIKYHERMDKQYSDIVKVLEEIKAKIK